MTKPDEGRGRSRHCYRIGNHQAATDEELDIRNSPPLATLPTPFQLPYGYAVCRHCALVFHVGMNVKIGRQVTT